MAWLFILERVMQKIISILTLAVALLVAILATAADKVVVIPLNTGAAAATADTKLWGEGRGGVTTLPYGTYNGINIARSVDLASWDGSAAACPQNTWVCSAADLQNWVPSQSTPYVTVITCGGATSGTSNKSWLSDKFNSALEGRAAYTFYENIFPIPPGYRSVTNSNEQKCMYLPVWCCSNAN